MLIGFVFLCLISITYSTSDQIDIGADLIVKQLRKSLKEQQDPTISIDVSLNLDQDQTILALISDDSLLNRSMSQSSPNSMQIKWPENFYISSNFSRIDANGSNDFKFVPFSFFSGVHSSIQVSIILFHCFFSVK